MKNPWKEKSKVNPQRERGTRQIANDVYIALYKAPFSEAELKVCLFVIHMTWGMGKHSDTISYSQFADGIDVSERHIKRVISELIDLRVLVREESERVTHGSPLNMYLFNKYYDTWLIWGQRGKDLLVVLKSCEKAVGKDDRGVTFRHTRGDISRTRGVTPVSPTKEIYQKKYSKGFEIEDLIKRNLNGIATKEAVCKVLRAVKRTQWWRVEKFLGQRYREGNSGQIAFLDAEKIVSAESDE